MSDIVSLYEKRVDRMMDKMFGDKSSELKTITKLTIMNKEETPEIKAIIEQMREDKLREEQMLLEEMTMTLDASGNVVPLAQATAVAAALVVELSPRQQDIKVIYYDN
jgi:L-lactate utilization protein LutB